MKKLTKNLLFLFVAIPLLFTSCSSNDDDETNNEENTVFNQYTHEETTYDILYAIIEYDSSNSEGLHEYYITFTDSNFNAVYFNIYSNSADGPEPGTYEYELSENPLTQPAFSFDYGEIVFNSSEDETFANITGGTITIADDETFEIEFSLVDEFGSSIVGHYSGSTLNYGF